MEDEGALPSPGPAHHSLPVRGSDSKPDDALTIITERVKKLDVRCGHFHKLVRHVIHGMTLHVYYSGQRKLLHVLSGLDPPLSSPTTLPPTPLPPISLPTTPSFDPTQRHSTPEPASEEPLFPAGQCGSGCPISTRSTGLRGEMVRGNNELAPATSSIDKSSLWRQQPIAGVGGVSQPVSGPYRPVSARTTGLRGTLRGHSVEGLCGTVEEGTRSQPQSRPVSGRLTGLRGILACKSRGTPVAQFSSEPNLHSPKPRPGTAVLAQGHRPLRVGPLDTDVVALPIIASVERGEGDMRDEADFEPPLSTEEPQDSTHLPHPSPDLEECLASISHFDHSHLGQLGRNSQGSRPMHVHTVMHVYNIPSLSCALSLSLALSVSR